MYAIIMIFLIIPAAFVLVALVGSLFGRMPGWLRAETNLWSGKGRTADQDFYTRNQKAGGKGMPKSAKGDWML